MNKTETIRLNAQEIFQEYEAFFVSPLSDKALIVQQNYPWIQDAMNNLQKKLQNFSQSSLSVNEARVKQKKLQDNLWDCQFLVCSAYSKTHRRHTRDSFLPWMKWDNKEALHVFFKRFFENIFSLPDETQSFMSRFLKKSIPAYIKDFKDYEFLRNEKHNSLDEYKELCNIYAAMKGLRRLWI